MTSLALQLPRVTVAAGSAKPTRAREDARRPVAVLGGGVTGLSAAWHLRKLGIPVVVFEAAKKPGGVVDSIRDGEWLIETGPNTLFENTPAIASFLESLNLPARRLAASPAAQRRYVVRDGRPVALPASPWTFLSSPLLSWPAKLRLLKEPFCSRCPADRDESVAEFVTRRLGREFLDYIVNPFVAGVFAGDPAALSVQHAFPKLHALEQEHGSLLRGSIARRNATAGPRGSMISFPEGLAEIPRALAERLGDDLRLNHRVTEVRRTDSAWQIGFTSGGLIQQENFSAVICALPPDVLARLPLEGVPGADALTNLQFIPQPPVASVFLGFRRDQVSHPLDGFGLLTPAVEQRRILGTLFSSTLFPGRAPAGHVALTTFVGGTRQPELARASDSELLASVELEMAALLGVQGAPVFRRVQRWPRAIAQYVVGFQQFKDTCTTLEKAAPGFFIGGTSRDGVSLSNCITAGERLARAVLQHSLPR